MGSELTLIDRRKFMGIFTERAIRDLGLTAAERKIWDENPHVRQVLANKQQLVLHRGPLTLQDRFVDDSSPRTPYSRRQVADTCTQSKNNRKGEKR